MAIKFSFVDNEVYGTEDINDITRCLVGAGVAPFLSKDSYNVSDLNAMTSAIAEQGVQLGGCKVTVQNTGTAEMTATVDQGIIFFESGVKLEVDSDGYSIDIEPNTEGFVFAHYNPILQSANIVFATQPPEDGQYVLLAKISETGSVFDKRNYAKSKIATFGKNITTTASFETVENELIEGSDGSWNYYIKAEVKNVNLDRYNYAVIETGTTDYGTIMVDLNQANGEYHQLDCETYMRNWYVRMVDGRLCFVEATGSNAGNKISQRYGEEYTIILV